MQVGVHHYPRVAGTATGGSPRVILRAMRETVLLWLRMHWYRPPVATRNPRPPYLLGDAAMLAGAGLVTAVLATLAKRRWR